MSLSWRIEKKWGVPWMLLLELHKGRVRQVKQRMCVSEDLGALQGVLDSMVDDYEKRELSK